MCVYTCVRDTVGNPTERERESRWSLPFGLVPRWCRARVLPPPLLHLCGLQTLLAACPCMSLEYTYGWRVRTSTAFTIKQVAQDKIRRWMIWSFNICASKMQREFGGHPDWQVCVPTSRQVQCNGKEGVPQFPQIVNSPSSRRCWAAPARNTELGAEALSHRS